jgi:hypothetical protein
MLCFPTDYTLAFESDTTTVRRVAPGPSHDNVNVFGIWIVKLFDALLQIRKVLSKSSGLLPGVLLCCIYGIHAKLLRIHVLLKSLDLIPRVCLKGSYGIIMSSDVVALVIDLPLDTRVRGHGLGAFGEDEGMLAARNVPDDPDNQG